MKYWNQFLKRFQLLNRLSNRIMSLKLFINGLSALRLKKHR